MKKFIFKIVLKDTKPLIWRKFEVRENITFFKFHEIIQIIMGWGNFHFFKFESPDLIIDGENEEEFGDIEEKKLLNSKKIKINNYFSSIGKTIEYIYDFDDYWEHDIILENVIESKEHLTLCHGGEGACPPDDCGGTIGLEDCLLAYKLKNEGIKSLKKEVLLDNTYVENLQEISEWIGDWNPKLFDLVLINSQLKKKRV